MKNKKIYIGTSGWYYKHWMGYFYPKNLKTKDQFKYYNQHFNTVEINNTFYKLPSKDNIIHWKKESSKDFIFSIKASRYITHVKKLKNPKKHLLLFLNNIKNLKSKLGPILFQLPAFWNVNVERFEKFIKILDKDYKYAFEFRDKSWFNEDIFFLLKKYKLAFCIYDLEGFQTPLQVTSNFVYIRLHGPKSAYRGLYNKKALHNWGKIIKDFQKDKLDIFCYFNNDEKAYAVKNALEVNKIVKYYD